jgi:hypothetical protein
VPFGADGKAAEYADDGFFQIPQIAVKVGLKAVKVEDGIPDELTRTVVGYVASPLDGNQVDALIQPLSIAGKDMIRIAGAADGEHRVMFREEQDVGNRACASQGECTALDFQAPAVLSASEADGVECAIFL